MKVESKISIRLIVFLFAFASLFGFYLKIFNVRQGHIIPTSGCFYYIILIAVLLYTVKGIEKKRLDSIGFDLHNLGRKLVLGIGIFVILEMIFTLYFFLIYGEKPQFIHLSFIQTLFKTIYFIFLVGFAEELIFRGYLFQRLNEILKSKIYTVLLSSVIFALWHYPVYYYFGQVIFAFFFGIILSAIRAKIKGNIIISLAIAHGLYNSFLYLGGYFIK